MIKRASAGSVDSSIGSFPARGNLHRLVLVTSIRVCRLPFLLVLLFSSVFAASQAQIATPTPGSTLSGSTVTFNWNADASATGYWLDLGSVPGGNTYYQSGNLGNVLTTTVSGLPTNGSAVYATLYSLVSGQWVNNAYTYTAAAGGVLTTPTPGSRLSGGTVTFNWTAGSGTAYWVDVGSTAGGNQYLQSGNLGNVLTTTVSGLPLNGGTVYVTLYSLISGQWVNNAYTYTAAAGGILTTPTPGSTLASSAVTFNWTAGSGTAYWLDVGSTVGGNQYLQSGNLGNVLTTTVNGLPLNGSTVYVTLYSLIGGQWASNAYTYTALNASAGLAVMQTPTPASTLSGNPVIFTWSADANATAYWLDIGNVAGGNTIYQTGNLGNVLTTTVNNLPANTSTIYVTLYSLVAGQWFSNAYTYISGPVGSFVATGTMGFARQGQTATQLASGQVLVAGGLNASAVLSSAEVYNLTSQIFAATANPMNVARWWHTATLLNDGTVLIAGGSDLANEETLDSAEIYDPVAGTFTLLPNTLNTARVGHTATLLSNGQVLIVGGYDPNSGIISDAELYDPIAQVFIDLGDTNSPRFHHAATLLQNGQVLIAGGETDPTPSGAYNTAEIFNPQTWTFSPLTVNMVSAREGHAATLLNDGTVLITGGDLPPTGSLSTAEVYNSTSNTFTAVSTTMTTPRIYHDAVLLNGGNVLLSGGENDSSGGTSVALNTAELYNPTTQTFTATTGNMTSVREHQTATLLNDGTVLEDGGTDGTNVFNTAEIYTTSKLTGLASIAISSPAPSAPLGSQQLLVATGTFNGGSTQILSSVLWSSSPTTVTTISGDASDNGYLTTVAQGTATITATAGGISGSTNVTVPAPSLVSITLTPQTLAMPLGTTQQFDAVGTYSDGSTQDLTSTATWTSSAGSATVSSTGLVTATAVGTSTIQASSGSQNSSTIVTIGSPTLVSLSITPSTAMLALGLSLQYGAVGTYTDGSTQNLASAVTWSIVPQGSASMNSAGSLTAIVQGSVNITAFYGGFDGVSSLTIGPPNLTSIAVSPGVTSIAIGNNQQFVATGLYTDGSSQDLTASVTWSSSSGTVSTISATGLATSLANGNTTIAASSGSVTGTAALTVGTATLGLNTSRYQHNATLLNSGSVLIAGGVNCPPSGSCTYLNTAELYNPSSATITRTGTMATARSAPAVLLGNGTVLVAGGYACDSNGNCASLNSAEIYDPVAATFSSAGNMTASRSGHTMTLLNSGQVLIAGGETCSSSTSCTALNSAELYNPSTGTFTATGSLNAARFNASAVALNSGEVLIVGGFNGTSYPATAELYDPVAATFANTSTLNTPRANATATLLDGGYVLIAGGTTCATGCPTSIAELYQNGNFFYFSYPTSNMTVPRWNQSATLLTNGQILIAGGYDACTSSCTSDSTTELFNPQGDTFASSQALSTGRSGHTATLLPDGSVLLIGGINNGITLSTVDSYVPTSLSLPQLASIAISPSNTSMALGTTLPLVAIGTDPYGDNLGPIASVVWSSSSPNVASVSNAAGSSGIVSAQSAGTSTISATVGSVNASTLITVTASLVSLSISPSNPTAILSSPQEVQLTATANYSDGSSQNLTTNVTWSTSNSSVASVISNPTVPGVSAPITVDYVAVAPVAAGTANITATLGNISGTTSVTVVAPPTLVPPSITAVSPTGGTAGTQVTLSGSGFGTSQGNGIVLLGSTLGTVLTWTDTQVVATVNTGSSSGVAQILQNNLSSNAVPFTVNTATITGISPNSGLPGTQVTITGSGFGGTQLNGIVWLGTAPAVVDSWTDGQVIATVATGSTTGTAQILQNGVWSNSVAFSIDSLQITSVSPDSGSAGTVVTITGGGFGTGQGNGNVWIGNTYGIVTGWSDTQIVASVASSAVSGVVKVEQNGSWSNALAFRVPSGSGSGGGGAQTLAPDVINMVVGGSQSIQALNSGGQSITGLTWTSSNTGVATLSTDDPPIITAVAPGNTTVTAGNASADVTVSADSTLPTGTNIWSNSGDGSGVIKIIPAIPSATGGADVFALQQSGTVMALRSDGTQLWQASGASAQSTLVPDFQGGVIVTNPSSSTWQKLDGVTGQPYPAVQWSGGQLLVHPDGTVFDGLNAIDPTTGNQKFPAPQLESGFLWEYNGGACGEYSPSTFYEPYGSLPYTNAGLGQPIIAGDGNAYFPYGWSDTTEWEEMCVDGQNVGWGHIDAHLRILRLGTDGSSLEITLGDWAYDFSPQVINGSPQVQYTYTGGIPNLAGSLLTNADQGVLYSWGGCFLNPSTNLCNPQYSLTTVASDGTPTTVPTNIGGSNVPSSPYLLSPVQPVLQRADNSYIGTANTSAGSSMMAFTASGQQLWSQPNDTPQIATSDNGIIGASGILYDQDGNVTGQLASLPIQSWTGNSYQLGSVDQVSSECLFDEATESSSSTALTPCLTPSFDADAGPGPSPAGTAAVNVTFQKQVQTIVPAGTEVLPLDGIAIDKQENVLIALPNATKKLTLTISLVSTGTNPVQPTTKATFANTNGATNTTVTLTKVKGGGIQGVVQILGQNVSDKAGDVTLVATGSDGNSYGSQSFTVVSVLITANTGMMQQKDPAGVTYDSLSQPPQLGPTLTRLYDGGPLNACGMGIEYVGLVSPKDYTGRITLRRFVTSYVYVWNMSNPSSAPLQNTPGSHSDNSKDGLVSTNVDNGFVFDIDTPGPQIGGLAANSVRSYRANFTEFAQLGNWLQETIVGNVGTTASLQNVLASSETASPPLNSYAAVSCNASGTGGPQFNSTYQSSQNNPSNNDNTGGAGCTLTGVAAGTCN